jgi:hypothetical protein
VRRPANTLNPKNAPFSVTAAVSTVEDIPYFPISGTMNGGETEWTSTARLERYGCAPDYGAGNP